MRDSKKIQSYRGRKVSTNSNIEYIWERKECRGSFEYFINRKSQLLNILKSSVDNDVWNKFEIVLNEIEKNLPCHQIYLDEAQNNIVSSIPNEREFEVEELARVLIQISLQQGDTKEDIIERLFKEEPFNNFLNLKNRLLEEEL